MSLHESLKRLQAPEPKKGCKFGRWIDSLPEEDQDNVAAMLSLDISDVRLHDEIRQYFDVSRDTLRLHRDQKCKCFV